MNSHKPSNEENLNQQPTKFNSINRIKASFSGAFRVLLAASFIGSLSFPEKADAQQQQESQTTDVSDWLEVMQTIDQSKFLTLEKKVWSDLIPSPANANEDYIFIKKRMNPYGSLPQLFYDHESKDKIVNKNNLGTPSMVIELSVICKNYIKDEIHNAEVSRDILNYAIQTAVASHRDAERISSIFIEATKVNEANLAEWKAVLPYAENIERQIRKIVSDEKSAAKQCNNPSGSNELTRGFVIRNIPKSKNDLIIKSYDPYKELLQDSKPFEFTCSKKVDYNSYDVRPQSPDALIESVFQLRNVARVYFEAAVQRNKAYKNIEVFALKQEKNKEAKSKLLSIAKKGNTSNKKLLDGWEDLINEKSSLNLGIGNPIPLNEGSIVTLVKMLINAVNNQNERALKIKRCNPDKQSGINNYITEAVKELDQQSQQQSSDGSSDDTRKDYIYCPDCDREIY